MNGKKNKRGARNIFGVVGKSTIWEVIGKKRGGSEEDSRIHKESTRFRIHILFQ